MRRSRKAIWFVALVLATAATWFYFPVLQGAGAAARDHTQGTRRLYALGCTIGPVESREPVAFRYEELLRQRYSIQFEGIGGFAPSDSSGKYAIGYNWVTILLVNGRPGAGFLKRIYAEAARDVTSREATLRGCLTDHELILPTGERIEVWAKKPITESDLAEHRMAPVLVKGKLTEVREGEWNKRFGRRLQAQKITNDTNGRCSGDSTSARGERI